jgi:acyl-CoA synthetase (AMP-forming)/AMP-acid ligase II
MSATPSSPRSASAISIALAICTRARLHPDRLALIGSSSIVAAKPPSTPPPAKSTSSNNGITVSLLQAPTSPSLSSLPSLPSQYRITYRQLVLDAIRVAQYLRSTRNIKPGQIVAQCLHRSAEQVTTYSVM